VIAGYTNDADMKLKLADFKCAKDKTTVATCAAKTTPECTAARAAD